MVHREDAVETECAESEVDQERGRVGCDPVPPKIAAHAVAEVAGTMRGRADAESSTADELVGRVPHDAEVVLDARLRLRFHHACGDELRFVFDGRARFSG